MVAQSNAPIIIKRKKVIVSGGHHGGAWKVAYADFVTAMMAFFMLMWLLNATTETQRKGIADYFSPTIPFARISGGGDNALSGDSTFSEDILSKSGSGGVAPDNPDVSDTTGAAVGGTDPAANAELNAVEAMLTGRSGESMVSDDLLRHIVTRVTDEGLIVDLFDLPDALLFYAGTQQPTDLMIELTGVVAEVFNLATNGVAVNGHVRAEPVVLQTSTIWDMSAARAQAMRQLLGDQGLPTPRIKRVSGFADRKPTHTNLMDVRNNRIELILLR